MRNSKPCTKYHKWKDKSGRVHTEKYVFKAGYAEVPGMLFAGDPVLISIAQYNKLKK